VVAAGCARAGNLLKDPHKARFGDTIAIYALAP
jgi:hypothetical protein